jgi:phosphotransferase system HPr-like phosphotransfer protein
LTRRIASAPSGKTGAVEQTVSFGNLSECRGKVADMRSILSIVSLCATMRAALDIETIGNDEHDATHALEQLFSSHDAGDGCGTAQK